MKILLVGNHTCGNRGDSAILRGIINSLEELEPNIQIEIISRFATSSSFLLGRQVEEDILNNAARRANANLKGKLKRRFYESFIYKALIAHIEKKGILQYVKLPLVYKEFTDTIRKYDAVIQVGGSFFVDLYGSIQFEHALCALMAKKPIYMIGHSVGPFKNKAFNDVAKYVFSNVESLILRENVSLNLMKDSGIPTNKVRAGIDTAWLVSEKIEKNGINYALLHWKSIIINNKTIAMTFRKLAPFDKRLGITQEQYMESFTHLINHLTAAGYNVVAFSTCTGIEGYNNDDRMVALKIKDKISDNDKFHIIMDEFNDVELGQLLAECVLTIGTRLHSAIISMNFGTPAVAINYEHKSLGIMQQLDFSEMAIDIKELIDKTLVGKVMSILENLTVIKIKMDQAVRKEREKGKKINSEIINNILSQSAVR
ncbi:colanic acid biosynthesis pyruvyl transferase WcaK [Acerihabitans arboris]|uniref:Colanic acid biosynthesis pyruvyl transferase WcaK n=1 Tax=Acerihabitans arboris TaxID=2691583 RepID=A0A845SL54_9GAMM|nr:colanic acid biosynthesis pyruvyl transferase WcaK [Acerihabitans arboris]NDL66013.1 colanic acid biosynthesis pyruvyl transferase WcaK [Acerihabitans arboris]